MRIIHNTSLDPCFNLAAEEYLLENTCGDVFMLWRNGASVIIGRNQNAWTEVNTDFTESCGIPVVRRLTGGGAVFHDPGNVNFTFITDGDDSHEIDFTRFTSPVISALILLGIDAAADGRNDIIAEGFKISGNAQCRHGCSDGRQRIMHHGTLLYDADLTSLAGALRVSSDKLRSKGIRSVSSRVKNIRDIGKLSMDTEEFFAYLLDFAEREYGCAACGLSDTEICGISALAGEKYSSWEWNFGRSPEGGERRTRRFPWGSITADFTTRHGIVENVVFTGDFFDVGGTEPLSKALEGCRFSRDDVRSVLSLTDTCSVISGASVEDMLMLLFGDVSDN